MIISMIQMKAQRETNFFSHNTKNLILICLVLSFVLITLILSTNAHASKTLIFGTGEWEPITSSKLENNGLASEIVKNAFAIHGVNIHIKFLPWKRCEYLLSNQKLDAIFPYTKTPERNIRFNFSDPVVVVRTHFFYMKNKIKQLKFKSYKDLKPYRIGGILGYYYQTTFDKAGLNVEYVSTTEQNIKKLLAGRVDLTPIANISGWYLIKNQFPEAYDQFMSSEYDLVENRLSDDTIASRVMVLKTGKKRNKIIEKYNSGLKKIKQNGLYDNILIKYGLK